MARQKWAVGTGVMLGLLVLAVTGRADEAAAVKMIEKLGGKVTRDAEIAGEPIVGVNLFRSPVTAAELKHLKEIKSLKKLNLSRAKVTDAGLKVLKELKSLETLDLDHTQVTDAG